MGRLAALEAASEAMMTTSDEQSTLDQFRHGEWGELRWWQMAPLVPVYVAILAFREALRDQVQVLAAHLAFITALAIVPLLSVGLWMLSAFGLFEESNNADLVAYIQQLFPAVAYDIAGYLHEFANTSARDLGAVGAIALMVVGVFLYMWVEKTFNSVWSTGQKRPWYLKILAFYAMITLGPVALSASILITARAQIRLSHMGLDTSFLDAYLPLGLGIVVFGGLNFLMPHAKVKWYAAAVAGISSAIAFEVAKWGFNVYVTELVLESYNTLYGAVGLLPLFLIWLYVLWIIVLGGAELAYATQNLRTLIAVRTSESSEPQKHQKHVMNPLIGLELYAPIARRFKAGEGSMPEPELTQRSGYSEALVREVVDKMETGGLVVVVEEEEGVRSVMPSKQLDDIDLLDLVQTFFDLEYEGNSVPMNELTQGYRGLTLEVLRSRTALDLIAEHAAFQQKYGGMAPWKPIPQSVLSSEYPRSAAGQGANAVSSESGQEPGQEPELGADAESAAGDDDVSGTRRLKPGRDKGNITWIGPEDDEADSKSANPKNRQSDDESEVDDVAATRPEADDLPDAPPDEKTTPMASGNRASSNRASSNREPAEMKSTATLTFDDELLYPYEADLSGDEILVSDADIEAADEDDFRQTAELDAEEVELMDELVAELGDELSAPPPMPSSDAK